MFVRGLSRKIVIKPKNRTAPRVYIPAASNNGGSLRARGSIGIIVFLDPPSCPVQWVDQVKCAHTNHVPGQREKERESGGPKMYWWNANYARITMPGSHSRPDATEHSAWCYPTASMRRPRTLERAFSRATYRSSAYPYTPISRILSACSRPALHFAPLFGKSVEISPRRNSAHLFGWKANLLFPLSIVLGIFLFFRKILSYAEMTGERERN